MPPPSPGGPLLGIDVQPPHVREVEHHPPVSDAVAGGVVQARGVGRRPLPDCQPAAHRGPSADLEATYGLPAAQVERPIGRAGPVNVAAALRRHARDLYRPLTTLGISLG